MAPVKGLEWTMWNIWREEKQKYVDCKGNKSHAVKNCLKLSAVKVAVIFSLVLQLALMHILRPCIRVSRPGPYVLSIACRSASHTDGQAALQMWGIAPWNPTWHGWGTRAKTVPGLLWEIKMQTNLQVSSQLANTQNTSLPPSLPRFCLDGATSLVASLQAHKLFLFLKALRGFAFLMWCWYHLLHSFFHGQ